MHNAEDAAKLAADILKYLNTVKDGVLKVVALRTAVATLEAIQMQEYQAQSLAAYFNNLFKK